MIQFIKHLKIVNVEECILYFASNSVTQISHLTSLRRNFCVNEMDACGVYLTELS